MRTLWHRRRVACTALAACVGLAACWASHPWAGDGEPTRDGGDDVRPDARDGGDDVTIPADGTAADGDADADGRDGGWEDIEPPDGWPPDVATDVGPGELEFEESTLASPESGEDSTTESCHGARCAAFSGTLYGIILQENTPWDEDSEFVGVYRMDRGGTVLDTAWIDSEPDRSEGPTAICWSGRAFLASLFTESMGGVRLVAVDEGGSLLREPSLVAGTGGTTQIVCPEDGPFLLEQPASTDLTVRRLTADGLAEGPPTTVPFETRIESACIEAGAEAVCPADGRIVFVSRGGTARVSDPIEMGEWRHDHSTLALAYTGDAVTYVWTAVSSGDKAWLYHAEFSLDGHVVIPPHPTAPGGRSVGAGSNGETTLVFLGLGNPGEERPTLVLLDRLGLVLGGPTRMPGYEDAFVFWNPMGVFWEGDAYGVLWNTWPREAVLYSRWRIRR